MKTKTVKALPKTANEITNGGVYRQHVRCGKPNCKCAGGELHTAFYFFTRRCGKIVKIYIRKKEFIEFSSLARQSAAARKLYRQTVKSNSLLLKQLREILREKTLLINSLKEDSNL
jgi:hypothetical protein